MIKRSIGEGKRFYVQQAVSIHICGLVMKGVLSIKCVQLWIPWISDLKMDRFGTWKVRVHIGQAY
jgi:hypothetical protein